MKKICILILSLLYVGTNIGYAQFKRLYDFDKLSSQGSLTVLGNVLYGINSDAIFSVNIDGTDYKKVCDINGYSYGSLVYADSVLYGTKLGPEGIFSVHTDGSHYNLLYDFPEPVPSVSSLTRSNNVLYGTTGRGAMETGDFCFPSILMELVIRSYLILREKAACLHTVI